MPNRHSRVWKELMRFYNLETELLASLYNKLVVNSIIINNESGNNRKARKSGGPGLDSVAVCNIKKMNSGQAARFNSELALFCKQNSTLLSAKTLAILAPNGLNVPQPCSNPDSISTCAEYLWNASLRSINAAEECSRNNNALLPSIDKLSFSENVPVDKSAFNRFIKSKNSESELFREKFDFVSNNSFSFSQLKCEGSSISLRCQDFEDTADAFLLTVIFDRVENCSFDSETVYFGELSKTSDGYEFCFYPVAQTAGIKYDFVSDYVEPDDVIECTSYFSSNHIQYIPTRYPLTEKEPITLRFKKLRIEIRCFDYYNSMPLLMNFGAFCSPWQRVDEYLNAITNKCSFIRNDSERKLSELYPALSATVTDLTRFLKYSESIKLHEFEGSVYALRDYSIAVCPALAEECNTFLNTPTTLKNVKKAVYAFRRILLKPCSEALLAKLLSDIKAASECYPLADNINVASIQKAESLTNKIFHEKGFRGEFPNYEVHDEGGNHVFILCEPVIPTSPEGSCASTAVFTISRISENASKPICGYNAFSGCFAGKGRRAHTLTYSSEFPDFGSTTEAESVFETSVYLAAECASGTKNRRSRRKLIKNAKLFENREAVDSLHSNCTTLIGCLQIYSAAICASVLLFALYSAVRTLLSVFSGLFIVLTNDMNFSEFSNAFKWINDFAEETLFGLPKILVFALACIAAVVAIVTYCLIADSIKVRPKRLCLY